MGIENLEDILQKQGKEKLTEILLKGKVSIAEKINAHRVSFLKDKLNNIEFYTKRKGSQIRTIDRVISDLYDPFITHILSNKDRIPQGYYNLYFFAHNLDVSYTKKPLNNLLLTDVKLDNNADKFSIEDLAALLDVTPQIEVYNGKLMKRKHLKDIFGYLENGGNLPETMTKIFGDTATTLSEKSDDPIEGYVIKIDGTLYKIEDNRFVRISYPKVNTSAYEMLVEELVQYVSEFDFTQIKLEVKNKDLRYANFIFTVFEQFLNDYGDGINSILISPPAFLSKTGNLGKKYIPKNIQTLLINEKYSYLLKIMLSLFSKKLNKRGLISSDTVKTHKEILIKINEYTKVQNQVFDFNEFKKFSN